jgi:HK97 family phage portal protein
MNFGLLGSGTRALPTSLEDPRVSLSDPIAFNELFGGTSNIGGEAVNEDAAMGVTAIWQAINCIAGTIAHLPLHLYTIDKEGNASKKTKDPLYRVVHDRANEVHTAFQFWKWVVTRLQLEGRAIAILLHDQITRVQGFLPVPASEVSITQVIKDKKLTRTYTHKGVIYEPWQVLDFALNLKSDGVTHYNPVHENRNAISLIIAAERYSATLFANGGIPPLTLEGPPMSAAASARATTDFEEALRGNRSRNRKILNIPTNFKLSPLGLDPSKQQVIELRKWQVSEVSRIFNIAPAMLHDLTTGTYSNVEQQNLSFAQHTIAPIIELIEQELNAKLFGERNKSDYVEFNMDGLQRGDFLSRMEGSARAVNSGIRTPNEIRAYDNLAPLPGGDKLYIQGATVPLENAGKVAPAARGQAADPIA